ncbi:ComF family protein [Neisseria yangbaofengii]|uniref:ComF family protein n=1 Tax=Neisseria yangbaofengii TaxID=2709396 RepID=UPI0013EC59C6|nr:ComF family protein [Neisseria yangbaofengii]
MDFLSYWRRMKQRSWWRAHRCVLCHDSASDGLCRGCLADLSESFTDAVNSCPLCFRQIVGGAVCGQCQKKPPKFERMWASVYYEAPVSGMVHQFKHLGDMSMRRPLADLMRRHAPDWLDIAEIDFVLPMPLSKARRLYRGFNQSEELAESLTREYGWQVLPRQTVERAHKPPQSTLKSDERRRNVRNIFKINKPLPENCKILLIDDVLTTGATLNELAKMLKASGASAVYCWCLARSQLKR